MSVQFSCQNERRREAVRLHPTLNGIDTLEVLDQDSPEESLRQRTQVVYFLKDITLANLSAANLRIEGGVRVKLIQVQWVYPVSAFSEPLFSQALVDQGVITAAELAYFQSAANFPEPGKVLAVRTDLAGDFSTYRLKLVSSPMKDEPPAGFDKILSSVDFSFKADCPSDFDCDADPACPPETPSAPPIDYLSRDYSSFRRLMLDRLSTTMPKWVERNPSDGGIVLVEVLAYAADHLSYYQDAVATEAYLGTARRRTSLRRHARLLDYPMHEGCNARTWAAFTVADGSDEVRLKAAGDIGQVRPRLLTRCVEGESLIGEARFDELLNLYTPVVFELMDDSVLYHAHNAISFYTWQDEECCLPKGATRATLRDNVSNRLKLRVGDVLIFQERVSPATGTEADADPAHRHAVRLTRVEPEAQIDPVTGERFDPLEIVTDPVTDPEQPVVEIEWDAVDALPFPLCISAWIDGRTVEDLSVALGNIVLIDQGLTLEAEALHPDVVPDNGRYRPRLDQPEVTHRVPYEPAEARERPAAEALEQDPRESLPAVELTADGETWIARRDLLASDRFAAEIVVEVEEDTRAYVRFGDGILGRLPTGGTRFKATYRVGNGQSGNIGANSIAHLFVDLEGITSVTNPLPAKGGTDPEPIEDVRQYAPQAFRTQERAVTVEDYAEVTERHPQVQQARATLRWTGSWRTVFITVDRTGGRPVDATFEAELRGFLERYRMAGHDLEIDGPRFVPLEITLSICVAPGYLKSDVEEALLLAFSSVDLPDGRRGFFHPDNFSFGDPVYLSRVVAAAMEVTGVKWVDVSSLYHPNTFKRLGEAQGDEIIEGRIPMGRLEIARLDNDPNAPENGKLEFFLEGSP